MLFIKKLPYGSLLLLMFTYGIFGWLISKPGSLDITSRLWLSGATYILLIALALAAPFTLIRSFYTSWLKSDTTAFFSVIIGAFVAVIIINWLDIFVRILVLLSAGALARLDLQTAGYSEWQSFWILAIVPLSGFSLGVIIHTYIPVLLL